MSPNPGGWIDRIIGWCFGILFGVIALYCAVALIEAMLPTLIAIIGIMALVGLVIGGLLAALLFFLHGVIDGDLWPFDLY